MPKMHECPRKYWVVVVYRGNYSAFNGYHFTPSDYSEIRCRHCGAVWRTKADYVESLTVEYDFTRRTGKGSHENIRSS